MIQSKTTIQSSSSLKQEMKNHTRLQDLLLELRNGNDSVYQEALQVAKTLNDQSIDTVISTQMYTLLQKAQKNNTSVYEKALQLAIENPTDSFADSVINELCIRGVERAYFPKLKKIKDLTAKIDQKLLILGHKPEVITDGNLLYILCSNYMTGMPKRTLKLFYLDQVYLIAKKYNLERSLTTLDQMGYEPSDFSEPFQPSAQSAAAFDVYTSSGSAHDR